MTHPVDPHDAAKRLREALASDTLRVASSDDLRAVLDERDEFLDESSTRDREHHDYRATVLVLGDLLDLTVPGGEDGTDFLATRARVDAWARERRSERRSTESLVAIAQRRGIPREVLDPDRGLGDRLAVVIVTELRAAGWRAPDESEETTSGTQLSACGRGLCALANGHPGPCRV